VGGSLVMDLESVHTNLSLFFLLLFLLHAPPLFLGGAGLGFKEVFSPRSPADLEKDIGLGSLAEPRQKSPGSKC